VVGQVVCHLGRAEIMLGSLVKESKAESLSAGVKTFFLFTSVCERGLVREANSPLGKAVSTRRASNPWLSLI
jgi:hypothetical protein